MTHLRQAIDSAAAQLAEAGIDSARFDAEQLAAHVAGVDRGRLAVLDAPDDEFFARYHDAITARSQRIPLQHLLGSAAFGPVLLQVGPGVFTPRPETEALLEWAAVQPLRGGPLIVDLCTGSGALAIALATYRPDARIVGIERSESALAYARRNAKGANVELIQADLAELARRGESHSEFDARVDLVVANPPYIPAGAVLEPEVAQHDPAEALFGGPDGMAVIADVVSLSGRWLRPGGYLAVEHDDTTSELTVALITKTRLFEEIVARKDLTGRFRFVTARRGGVAPRD